MPLRIDHKLLLQVSADTTQKLKRYFHEDSSARVVSTVDFQHQQNGELNVADGTTESLAFGDVQVGRGFYLEVDGQVNLRLNGAVTPLVLRLAAGATVAKFFFEGEVTSVTVENPTSAGALPVKGSYCVWGDPVTP